MHVVVTKDASGELIGGDSYEFFAFAEGMRMPLRINAVCASDAEASLVAIALSTRIIGVEVLKAGRLIFQAPRRDFRAIPELRSDTPVMGHG